MLPALTDKSMAASWIGPSSGDFLSGVLGLLLLWWEATAGEEEMEDVEEGELGGICLERLGDVCMGFVMKGNKNVFCSVWWGLKGEVGVRKGFGARKGRWAAAEGKLRKPGPGLDQKSLVYRSGGESISLGDFEL